MTLVVCVDVGSTYTKAAAVELPSGVLVATAAHPTTIGTDVLIGLDAAVAAVAGGREIDELRVCSSAGGGLRLGVIGYERAITAEAGWRVGLSAGARPAPVHMHKYTNKHRETTHIHFHRILKAQDSVQRKQGNYLS